MWMKLIGTALGVLGWSAFAAAQYPNPFGPPGSGNFMPNIYNPQSQPLSPYLNMFRGTGNPAANYYFGTRPGTVGGAGGAMGGAPNIALGGNRALFFPQLASGPDSSGLPEADPGSGTVLPPAGHQVVFANTMGYFPSAFGATNRGGRPGMMGMGNNRQSASPRR